MARLDRYSPVNEVAQTGAAIGRQFSYALVAVASRLPASENHNRIGAIGRVRIGILSWNAT
jgi:hypothetical protein